MTSKLGRWRRSINNSHTGVAKDVAHNESEAFVRRQIVEHFLHIVASAEHLATTQHGACVARKSPMSFQAGRTEIINLITIHPPRLPQVVMVVAVPVQPAAVELPSKSSIGGHDIDVRSPTCTA